MTSADLAIAVAGLVAIVAGVLLLVFGDDAVGTLLVGAGAGVMPTVVYAAIQRREQAEQAKTQIEKLASLSFVVDPPRMAKITNALSIGKTMFAQTGPNVSEERLSEFTEDIRKYAQALGGTVPTTYETLLTRQLWPRRLFEADGSVRKGEEIPPRAKFAVEEAIVESADYVVSRGFMVGWGVQQMLSLVSVWQHDRSERVAYLKDGIFDSAFVDKNMTPVFRGASLGMQVCEATKAVSVAGSQGDIEMDDVVLFLIFLSWFTAHLSRESDSGYPAVAKYAEMHLDQIRNHPSSAVSSDSFRALAEEVPKRL